MNLTSQKNCRSWAANMSDLVDMRTVAGLTGAASGTTMLMADVTARCGLGECMFANIGVHTQRI